MQEPNNHTQRSEAILLLSERMRTKHLKSKVYLGQEDRKAQNISIPHHWFCSWKVTSPVAVESDRGLQAAPYFYFICSARSCSGRLMLDFNFQRCLRLQELSFICQNLDTEVPEKLSVGNECPSKLFQSKSCSGPDHAGTGSSQNKAM